MAKTDDKYVKTFEELVQKSLARIEQQSSNIELYIERRVEQEREKNNRLFAPYMAWTILLGILSLIGMAMVAKFSLLIGL